MQKIQLARRVLSLVFVAGYFGYFFASPSNHTVATITAVAAILGFTGYVVATFVFRKEGVLR